MTRLPQIVFTFPACGGGVTSFNYNIINYSKLIKNFTSKVILLKAKEDNRAIFNDEFIADEVIMFHYSNKENQYFVQKRLNELLSTMEGAIVTDNQLTIQAARRFNNPKTVFHLLHDYFYVNETIKMIDMIDACIAHSSFFSDAVYSANPEVFAQRNFYIPYGVKQLKVFPEKNNETLELVFLGRIDDGKGALLLHAIDEKLREDHITVNWSIIGKGPLKSKVLKQWEDKGNVKFYEPHGTLGVYDLLKTKDVFVFPTTFEGTPVSILECLSNGVVTITNDLPGGIRDIVTQEIGFQCQLNNIDEFVENISKLNNDRNYLRKLQENCFKLAQERYDIEKNADDYFRCFENYKKLKRNNKTIAPKMSRLDQKFIPNLLTKSLRTLTSFIT